uniref:AT-rich interaction domain 5B n=1 Tax=Macaca mulatta TaxID=9544 RepID=A0A5F8AJN3_MACMU
MSTDISQADVCRLEWRQILKADHAKRNHAHKEEIHSVVLRIPTIIPMAKPLPSIFCT